MKLKLFFLLAFFSALGFSGCSTVGFSVYEKAETALWGKPFLRIETGMHTAPISRISVDADERYIVTASDDKTARVWDIKTGALLKILRPPIGNGNEGKLYCAAISPDGKTVAVGGWTAKTRPNSIYIFDRTHGTLKHRIKGLPNVILHLEYSHDGKFLAACLGLGNGIRVFKTDDFSLFFKDTDYGNSSYWADFDIQGKMAATCYDGYIRLYDKNFKLIAKKIGPGGKEPFCVKFSGNGEKIAAGFIDSTKVNVLSGKDLSFLYGPDTDSIDNGNLASVAWSPDGKVLYAGGRYNDQTGTNPVIKWTKAGRGTRKMIPASTNTIMDIYPFSKEINKGRFAFGSQDPALGVLNSNGEKIWTHGPAIMNFMYTVNKLMISENGEEISFEFVIHNPGEIRKLKKASFSLKEPELILGEARSKKLSGPVISGPGLKITGWKNSYSPKLNSVNLPLMQYEFSRCLAIAPDKKHFLLGTEWRLRFFDSKGREKWKVPVPGVACAVNISGNNKIAVAAFLDGTIRWFSTEHGTELLSLFALPDADAWLISTRQGFFDAKGRGEKLAGYHLNQGPDKEGIFVKIEQLYELFYRPDLVAKALDKRFQDEIKLEAAKIDVRKFLEKSLPPEVKITSESSKTLKTRNFTLSLKLTEKRGGIGKIVYKLNGRVVGVLGPRGMDDTTSTGGIRRITRPFTLDHGKNRITATGYSLNGIASEPAVIDIDVDDPMSKPTSVYILSAGISSYKDPEISLKYAAKDAAVMAETFRGHAKALSEKEITVKTLINEKATAVNIEKAFKDLSKQIELNDLFIFYLAGHGETKYGKYHFIPWEFIYENEDSITKQGINHDKIQSLLSEIKAKKGLVIIDTCFSGEITAMNRSKQAAAMFASTRSLKEKGAISKLMRATGRTIIASASKLALEGCASESVSDECKKELPLKECHGIFTYAVIQGIKGEADRKGDKNSVIKVSELIDYVSDRVPEITEKCWGLRQYIQKDIIGDNFPIGINR